ALGLIEVIAPMNPPVAGGCRRNLGLPPPPARTRVYPSSAIKELPKSDISDFGWERGGVRGVGSIDRLVTPSPDRLRRSTSPLRGEGKLRHGRRFCRTGRAGRAVRWGARTVRDRRESSAPRR